MNLVRVCACFHNGAFMRLGRKGCGVVVLRFTRRAVSAQNIDVHVGALSAVCVVLCLSVLLLVCLPWLATVRRCGGALALFVWGTLYVTAVVFIFTGGPVTTWEQVRGEPKEKERVLLQSMPEVLTPNCACFLFRLLCCSALPCQVAFFLFLSLSVYTVLPLSMAWALMVGIWTSVSHIIIIGVYVPVTQPETPDLAAQVTMQSLS